jgi:hypothetical protein
MPVPVVHLMLLEDMDLGHSVRVMVMWLVWLGCNNSCSSKEMVRGDKPCFLILLLVDTARTSK